MFRNFKIWFVTSLTRFSRPKRVWKYWVFHNTSFLLYFPDVVLSAGWAMVRETLEMSGNFSNITWESGNSHALESTTQMLLMLCYVECKHKIVPTVSYPNISVCEGFWKKLVVSSHSILIHVFHVFLNSENFLIIWFIFRGIYTSLVENKCSLCFDIQI